MTMYVEHKLINTFRLFHSNKNKDKNNLSNKKYYIYRFAIRYTALRFKHKDVRLPGLIRNPISYTENMNWRETI